VSNKKFGIMTLQMHNLSHVEIIAIIANLLIIENDNNVFCLLLLKMDVIKGYL
jgi:hypothetical protein